MPSRKSARGTAPPLPTPRDREIMATLYKHGRMTREHIRRLFFARGVGEQASIQAVCRRLKKLTERGYLARVAIPVAKGSGPYVYGLGKLGAAVVSREAKVTGRVAVMDLSKPESLATLSHDLERVDFYIALKTALEELGGGILSWLGEREAAYSFAWKGRKVSISPDAYCLWALGDEEGAFFLEWDRGTESLAAFGLKLSRYGHYFRLKAYQDHLGETGIRPRLLVVASDERREGKLIDWLARRQARNELSSLPTVLFSTQPRVKGDILGHMWKRSDELTFVRLAD